MSVVDAHLEIDPEQAIEFTLIDSSTTSSTTTTTSPQKVTLTLKHPDVDGLPIAFKIKTTQPRRYLVRPNQGLILPGQIEVIQIVLIEKDALELLRTYQTLGIAALEQGGNKDKFLIQSTTVSVQDAQTIYTTYDAITTLWSSSSSSNHQHTHAMANKKLHVRYHIHSVSSNTTTAGTDPTITPTMHNRTAVTTAHTNSTPPLSSNHNNNNHTLPVTSSSTDPNHNNNNNNSMTKEQLLMDVQNIRRKYDELIAFSVNLTAERDLISNTLEVTKRDYKQLQSQSSQQQPQRFKSSTHQSAAASASATNRIRFFTHVVGIAMMMLLCSLLSLSFGIYIAQQQEQQEEDPSIYRIPSVLQPIVQYMVQMISTLLASTTNTNMTHTQLLLNADDTTTTTMTTNDEF